MLSGGAVCARKTGCQWSRRIEQKRPVPINRIQPMVFINLSIQCLGHTRQYQCHESDAAQFVTPLIRLPGFSTKTFLKNNL